MTPVAIFDLDDTLANTSMRSEGFDFDNATDPQWDEYFHKCSTDTPIEPVIAMLRALVRERYAVIILTGRNAVARVDTDAWLFKHLGLTVDEMERVSLVMRPRNNRQKNVDFKRDHINKIGVANIVVAVDDDEKVCNMYRSCGIMTLRVHHN